MTEAKEIARKHGLIEFMSIKELCEYAGCSERYIYEEIKRKTLRAYKPVREIMFDPKDVQAWMKRKVKTA
jgi:excisionase family DNA binding protein